MNEITTGIVGICILLAMFLTGIELAFGMTIVGFIGIAYLGKFAAASNHLVKDFFDTFTSYGFTVIPIFVLMGQIASNSDIAKKLYNAAEKFVGHIPGGRGHDHRSGGDPLQGHVRFHHGYLRNICRHSDTRDDAPRVQ